MFSKFPKAGHYTSATEENESSPAAFARRLQAILHNPWILGGLAAVLGLPLLGYHLTYDHGIYAVLGDTLRRGGIAYKDAWEFRPPGIFWANFISFILFGRSEFSIRLLDLIGVGASSAALFVLLRDRFAAPRAGVVAALSYPLIYVPCGHWATSQCEAFQAPLLLWSLALWPLPGNSSPPLVRCYFSGLLAGAAVLLKTPAVFYPVLLLLDRLFLDRRLTGRRHQAGLWSATSGILTLPVAMLMYYGFRGALADLIYALFIYAPTYAQHGPPPTLEFHLMGMMQVHRMFSIPVCLVSMFGLTRVWLHSRGEGLRLTSIFAATWLGIALQGRYYPQHLLGYAPWFALTAGLALLPSKGGGVPSPTPWSAGKKLVTLLLSCVFLIAAGSRSSALAQRWSSWKGPAESWEHPDPECAAWPFFSYESSRRLARSIQAASRPEDRIFVWTNDPLAVFMADRPLAGPYSHIGMILPFWEGPDRLEALVRRLRLETPDLIVIGGRGPPAQARTALELLEELQPLSTFIRERYHLAEQAGEYQFWKR